MNPKILDMTFALVTFSAGGGLFCCGMCVIDRTARKCEVRADREVV